MLYWFVPSFLKCMPNTLNVHQLTSPIVLKLLSLYQQITVYNLDIMYRLYCNRSLIHTVCLL